MASFSWDFPLRDVDQAPISAFAHIKIDFVSAAIIL